MTLLQPTSTEKSWYSVKGKLKSSILYFCYVGRYDTVYRKNSIRFGDLKWRWTHFHRWTSRVYAVYMPYCRGCITSLTNAKWHRTANAKRILCIVRGSRNGLWFFHVCGCKTIRRRCDAPREIFSDEFCLRRPRKRRSITKIIISS